MPSFNISARTLALLVTATALAHAQQPLQNASKAIAAMHQRTIQRQLDAELDLVETLVDLSRHDRAQVRASCESAMKTAATRRANPSQTAETKGNHLPKIVFTALIDAIE